MYKPITFVTALYDIDRENLGDGRTFDQYLSWFKDTLKIESPMVIYVDQSLETFVKECRGDLPTKIISQSLEKIPYYYLKDDIDAILKSETFKSKIGAPFRFECKSSLYNIVIFSKFKWVKEVVKNNYFNSEYFMWMDAGLSRFFYDIDMDYPSNEAINSLLECKDKVVIQKFMSYYPDLVYSEKCTKEYFWDARTWIMAGLWGGGSNILSHFCDMVDDVLINQMIKNEVINNEQNVMAYLYKNNPDMFIAFENYANMHRDYEFIQELSK